MQRPTSNVQRPTLKEPLPAPRVYDLDERLLDYAARVVRLSTRLPRTRAGNHVAKQLLKSGTSPLPNHAEAQAAESRADFIHKLRICLKELRESRRWLRLIERVPLLDDTKLVQPLLSETEELIRIFATSVRTSQQRPKRPLQSSKLNVER